MQCTKLTHECRPKWRRFLSAQRIKENLLTGTFHCVQPSPCCFFYVLCFQIAVSCSSHPTTLIHHHVAKYFRRDIRLCQNHFRFCRFSFAVISLLFRVQTINYVSSIFHDLKRNSWLFPDAPWPFQFLEFPWLSSDCLHGFRTESTYSLDCLPILLSISIFTFSFFHYLVLILCSRLSWLMRAFERSLKQHLVSYCMTFQDFSGRWEPKLQPFNRQNHRASITIQQKIVKAKDTLSFSCWQLRSAAANNISDSFNHGIEHSNCYTQQPNKVHIHTQPFNGLWSGTTRVGRYQKKHSPTHTHPDHRTSFIIFLHLQ